MYVFYILVGNNANLITTHKTIKSIEYEIFILNMNCKHLNMKQVGTSIRNIRNISFALNNLVQVWRLLNDISSNSFSYSHSYNVIPFKKLKVIFNSQKIWLENIFIHYIAYKQTVQFFSLSFFHSIYRLWKKNPWQ